MILIDIPMPESCIECPCMYDYIQCTALKDNEHESLSACDDYAKRQEWCPLKEVVLCKDCKKRNSWECWQYFFGRIKIPDDWFCADGERNTT